MRLIHGAALVTSFLLVCLTCSSQADPDVETIELTHARADRIASMFGPAYEPGEEAAAASHERVAVNFALGAFAHVARIGPHEQPQVLPVQGACEAVVGEAVSWTVGPPRAPRQVGGTAADLLPEGLDGPPEVAPGRNAVTVKGTPEAIDEFREIVGMLDIPCKTMELRVGLYELTELALHEMLPEMHDLGPKAGSGLSFGLGRFAQLTDADTRKGMARTLTEVQVTLANGQPTIISVGEILRLPPSGALARARYDAWFAGISLCLYPQIYPDDTVQLFLRGLAVEASGKPADVTAEDISSALAGEAMVRVGDGESLAIGGLRARLREQLREADAGEVVLDDALDSIISLTLHVIREGED